VANTNGQKLALGSQTTTPGLATGRSQISPGKRTLALGVAAIGDIIKNLAAVSRGKPDPQSKGVEAISGLLESRDEQLRQEKLENVQLANLASQMDTRKLQQFRGVIEDAGKLAGQSPEAIRQQIESLFTLSQKAGLPVTREMLEAAASDPGMASNIMGRLPILAFGKDTGSALAAVNQVIKKKGLDAADKFSQKVASAKAQALLIPRMPAVIAEAKKAAGSDKPVTIQQLAVTLRSQPDEADTPGLNNALASYVLGVGVDPEVHKQFVDVLGPDIQRPGFERELRELKAKEEVKEGPESPIGKLIADRDLFVRQFGEDSPQIKAFDERVAAEQKGKEVKLSDVRGMRQEFTKGSDDFVKIRDAFARVQTVANDPSAAGDLALIFNFMKILDPGSVVREGEFATAAAAGSVPQRIRAQYNRVVSGERLSATQRLDFLSQSQNLFTSQLRMQLNLETQFRGIAERADVDPNDVVVDFVGDLRNKGLQGGRAGTKKKLRFDAQGNPITGP